MSEERIKSIHEKLIALKGEPIVSSLPRNKISKQKKINFVENEIKMFKQRCDNEGIGPLMFRSLKLIRSDGRTEEIVTDEIRGNLKANLMLIKINELVPIAGKHKLIEITEETQEKARLKEQKDKESKENIIKKIDEDEERIEAEKLSLTALSYTTVETTEENTMESTSSVKNNGPKISQLFNSQSDKLQLAKETTEESTTETNVESTVETSVEATDVTTIEATDEKITGYDKMIGDAPALTELSAEENTNKRKAKKMEIVKRKEEKQKIRQDTRTKTDPAVMLRNKFFRSNISMFQTYYQSNTKLITNSNGELNEKTIDYQYFELVKEISSMIVTISDIWMIKLVEGHYYYLISGIMEPINSVITSISPSYFKEQTIPDHEEFYERMMKKEEEDEKVKKELEKLELEKLELEKLELEKLELEKLELEKLELEKLELEKLELEKQVTN